MNIKTYKQATRKGLSNKHKVVLDWYKQQENVFAFSRQLFLSISDLIDQQSVKNSNELSSDNQQMITATHKCVFFKSTSADFIKI